MNYNHPNCGQVMLLTVLAIGGTLLSATTVAGLLMLYQIRQSIDIANSAKAIMAADSGLEWGLYSRFCWEAEDFRNPCPEQPSDPAPLPVFSNRASVSIVCEDSFGSEVDCNALESSTVKSVGSSGASSRSFRIRF